MPTQLLGVAVLFGPLACGVVAAVNYARMGMKQYVFPCIFFSFALFLMLAALLIFQASPNAAEFVGVLANLFIGTLFQKLQQPVFEEWKQANWKPTVAGETYKPNRLGFLILLCLASLAVELIVIGLLVSFEISL